MLVLRTAPVGALCVLVAATLAVPPVAAQTTPLPSAPPAVQTAVQDLWTQTPQVQAAEADLRAAQERAKAADQPVYNPALQLDAENADVDRRTAGASLTLDVFGKRKARVVQAEAELRAEEAAFTLARRDVAIDWLKAWTGAALGRAQSALGGRRLELMQRFDTLAAQRLAVGDISSPERDLAALALAEAQIQQASLEAQELASRSALMALGGMAQATLPELPDELPSAAERVEAMPAEERPELVKAQAEQERAEAAVAVADRNRRSDPTVSLTGGRVRSGPRTDRVIGVSVSVPLPVRNSGRYEVSAARADADAAYAVRRAAQRRAEATLQQARATYVALRAASEGFQQGRASAFDERAALLGRLWQAGEISTSDYLVQLTQSLDTALSGLALKNQTWQAWFDYLAASGRLTDWVDGRHKDANP